MQEEPFRLLWLVLFTSLLGACFALGQADKPREPGPGSVRPELLEVPTPDLSGLDPAVADQIRSVSETLSRVLKEPGSSSTELAETFGMMGEIYHAYQFYAAAEACYANTIRLAGNRFRSLYLLAQTRQAQGRLEEALTSFQAAASIDPTRSAPVLHMANLRLQQGKLDESKRGFEAALKLDPASAAAHAGLGQVELKLDHHAEAVSALKRALEVAPGANRLHYLLAMAYRGLGDQVSGKLHLEQSGSVGVRVEDPIDKELEQYLQGQRAHLLRGRLAFMAGRFQEAIPEFREAMRAAPESCTARVNLAGALAAAGEAEEALRQYEAASEKCADSAVLHFNLGRLYLDRNEPAKALEQYEACLKLEPGDLAIVLAVSRLLASRGEVKRAVEHLNKAVVLHPDSEEAWYELAESLLREKDFAQARDRLEEAARRLPQQGRLAALLARLLAASPDLSLRDGSRALALAERVYAVAPTVQHCETLALALAESGRCTDAAAVLRQGLRVLEESGTHPQLRARMQRDLARCEQNAPCRPQ